MRIRVLSDLHLEHAPWSAPAADQDVVVLAGDIARGVTGIEWASQTFNCPVVYVPGNHEFDFGDIGELRAQFAQPCGRVHVLDNATVTLDGVRFVGSTLWTDQALYGNVGRAVDAAWRSISDYVRIRWNGSLLTPLHTIELHRVARAWLQQVLTKHHDGPTVVVTHHCPHPDVIHPVYADSPSNPSMASDLSDLITLHPTACWLHGHAHVSVDRKMGDTRIVCNPRGYAADGQPENPDFVGSRVVEI